MPTNLEHRPPRRGVTLLELLGVLAVVATLAAILVPALGRATETARRAKTRMQFAHWTVALEQFRAEYGGFPGLSGDRVNQTSTGGRPLAARDTEHLFHDVLAGRRRDGSALPPAVGNPPMPAPPEYQNRRRIDFAQFADTEFGRDGLLVDAFGNTDLAVIVDADGDGLIPAAAIAAAAVRPDHATVALAPGADRIPPGGVRAPVVFISPGRGWEDAQPDARALVVSWE